jgi:signal transduction histidine kinase
MTVSFIFLFHKFNRFLGTPGGELFKRSSELVLLVFSIYMVASEWLKTKSKHLLYLLVGFGSLAIEKMIDAFFLGQVIFAGGSIRAHVYVLDAITNFLEITALVLIASAFLYPVTLKHNIRLRLKVMFSFSVLVLFFTFSLILVFGVVPFLDQSMGVVIGYSIIELLKLSVLWVPIVVFWLLRENVLYTKNVIVAFIVYSVTPFLTFINLVSYGGQQVDLRVLAHPFPFIAIALFTRVLFMKLVDKATLREELSFAKDKYVREKEISMMKDEFISTVSHELRTPLTSLQLYVGLLLQGKFGNLSPKQTETIGLLKIESGRLGRLIDDILDLSKYEQKREMLVVERVNLFELVEKSISPVLSEQKNIIMLNDIQKNISVLVDSDKFKQVVVNIFSNALKYTGRGGSIIFNADVNDSEFIFSISDTGKGIDGKELPHIFDKFYQIDNHMIRKTGGVGLGLAIVKKIVDLHGGTITVESKVGKGTTFIVKIPQEAAKDQNRVKER